MASSAATLRKFIRSDDKWQNPFRIRAVSWWRYAVAAMSTNGQISSSLCMSDSKSCASRALFW
jgi:hypothetical protein